jgi:threonine/homoserine/homoserine lactone efflux protein
MTIELLIALAGFAFVGSVTPGPNNLMLMASGANFGLRRTLPHMLGVSLGHAGMVFLLGAGIGQVFVLWPDARLGLKVLATLYMLWLAWKIAHAAPPEGETTRGKPFTFLQAAAFQWVNPKAWAIGLTAVTVYAPDATLISFAMIMLVFLSVNLPSVSCWAVMGVQIRRLLTRPARLRAFNITMAVLLVASLYPVLTM